MSLAREILASFYGEGVESYAITRAAAPAIANGVATPGASAVVHVDAAIFPASATDLARTLEGERLRDLIVIYSADALRAGGAAGEPADLVPWNGATYEVEDVDPFPGGLFVSKARKKVAA